MSSGRIDRCFVEARDPEGRRVELPAITCATHVIARVIEKFEAIGYTEFQPFCVIDGHNGGTQVERIAWPPGGASDVGGGR